MTIKNDLVCMKIATNKHFILIFWVYFYSLIVNESGINIQNLITMKDRGNYQNGFATPNAGIFINLLNLTKMKRKVRFRSGHATLNAGKSDNHLTYFNNAL